tara:strand:- start:828 stop:1001 length:174 start_codon:yes stop_codon:yes gene_type:complete
MSKTKTEQSKELDDQVEKFLKQGGEIKQLDTHESKMENYTLSNKFFAKTNYHMFKKK